MLPDVRSGAGQAKAEGLPRTHWAKHLPRGSNPRFVVTTLSAGQMAAHALCEAVHCACGDRENRIKEQQLALFVDRTSAQTLWTYRLRLYLTTFAYVLLEILQR